MRRRRKHYTTEEEEEEEALRRSRIDTSKNLNTKQAKQRRQRATRPKASQRGRDAKITSEANLGKCTIEAPGDEIGGDKNRDRLTKTQEPSPRSRTCWNSTSEKWQKAVIGRLWQLSAEAVLFTKSKKSPCSLQACSFDAFRKSDGLTLE